MWFVWFYSISTAVCLICTRLIGLSIAYRIKNEYILKKQKKRNIVNRISGWLPFLVPFVNCLLVLVFIFIQEKLYEATVLDYMEKGEIIGLKE